MKALEDTKPMLTEELTVPTWDLIMREFIGSTIQLLTSFNDFFAIVGFVICLFLTVFVLMLVSHVTKRAIKSAIFVRRLLRAQRPFYGISRWGVISYTIVEWYHFTFNAVDTMYINGQSICWPGKPKD
jgi:hypothetical protein